MPGLLGPWPTTFRPWLREHLASHPEQKALMHQLFKNRHQKEADSLDQTLMSYLLPKQTPAYAAIRWLAERATDKPPSLQDKVPSFCADPINMQAQMHGARVHEQSLIQLSHDEAKTLSEDFNAFFAEDGYQWHIIDNRGYLFLDQPVDLQTLSLPEATETDILEWGYAGKDAAQFQRYTSEWQMWLHQHPLNTERKKRADIPLNAIWLWGEGTLKAAEAVPYKRIISDDIDLITQGLAEHTNLTRSTWSVVDLTQPLDQTTIMIVDQLEVPSATLEWDQWLTQLGKLLESVITPLLKNRTQFDIIVPYQATLSLRPSWTQYIPWQKKSLDWVDLIAWR